MAREFKRTDRLADEIQRILAHLLQFEVRDPRIGMVNINDVEVSRDLANAKVFVTFVDTRGQDECELGVEALNRAAGFLRSMLAKELDIRITPRLVFKYDQTSVRGQELSQLIDRAVKADKAHSESTAPASAEKTSVKPEQDEG
ncbi:30S ribosome-binding factor RbfA [Pseudomaricurvus alcaniphilus]|uniref:30S ribosome-binding factor RbfA n=1 Tax=Pseudomaricurvus alcaniphilus TaxID=1166482 RepID=UPI00140C3305|nr:30S ribosome-binding factor RbfA [Pseudomaricurvus alcaniphilus]NHN39523.1 30S ribosome-binding factor RbfA [Pseudomaricurvus alcaniphilus]